MSTNDLHPDGQSGWNRTSMNLCSRWTTIIPRSDLGPSSSSRTSLFRSSGERCHRVSCRGISRTSARVGAVNICCRGRNRTCERQINNLPSVPAHKPYKIGAADWAAPFAYTGDRHALHRTPSRRFLDCQRSRAHLRLRFRGLDSNQLRAVQSRTSCR